MQKWNEYETYHHLGWIKYYGFSEYYWYTVGGPKHPLFKYLVEKIKQRTNDDYEIYIIGGILEPWVSWDVDVVITGGTYNPRSIKYNMEAIVRTGFEIKIFCDAHYQEQLWRIDRWSKDLPNCAGKHTCYELANCFERDGEVIYYDFEPVDGIYRRTWEVPLPKHYEKKEEGHIYKPPIKVK